MPSVPVELKLAFRSLRSNPGYAVTAIATLALGIAATTTVFGWIDTTLLHPITGVRAPRELGALEAVSRTGERLKGLTQPDFRDFQRELTLASGVTAYHMSFFTIGPEDHPKRVMGQVVSANFFAVLGVNPFLGRTLTVAEDVDESGANPVAVISHRLWRGYFASNPKVVGSTVRLNGRMITIVGVTPPDFRGTITGLATDVWTPLSMATQMGALNTWAGKDRNARFLILMVRMKPGVTLRQITAQAQAVAARMAAAYPDTHRGVGAEVVSLADMEAGIQKTLGRPLKLLMAVCILVLLIACSNVANLLLTRSLTRRKEFGVRVAMGAGRSSLIRLLVAEVAPLGAAGALAGALLAQWGGDAMGYLFPVLDATLVAAAEPVLRPQLSPMTLLFCALVSAAAALGSVITPVLAAARMDIQHMLVEGGRSGMQGPGTHRVRSALVIAEVSLAALALVGAGAALRTFHKLRETPLGFEPDGVLVSQFHLSTNGYRLRKEREFATSLTERLRNAPGVAEAAATDVTPLSMLGSPAERFQVEEAIQNERAVPMIQRATVTPRFFALLGLPIVAGREFTDQDNEQGERVIIVNETLARQHFGVEGAVGRKVRISGRLSTIVGVARNAKYVRPGEPPTPYFYAPFRQIFFSGHNHFLLMRTQGDPAVARATLRREVRALDPAEGLYESAPMTEHIQAGTFAEKLAASLLGTLGLMALALAAVGLYGVLAYAVGERMQEFGIRMALGARPGQLLRQVMQGGLLLTVSGLVIGGSAAYVLLRMPLGGVTAVIGGLEPVVALGVVLVLGAVSALACFVPARRATKVDPLSALRAD